MGIGLVLALAIFSGLSSLWSGSIELSVTEADRVLVYLGVLLAAFLIAQTDQRRQRFAEGIGFALIAVALLGLGSRLLPHVFPVAEGLGSGPRLRYPLGYWNANGVACGIAAALIPWLSRRSLTPTLRWIAVACLPAVLLTLYFTYSRGGVLALLVAGGCLIALSHDRLWMIATLAIGVIGALPAVLAVQAHDSLADNIDNAAAVDQGAVVLLILIAGTALALGLFAGMRILARQQGNLTGKAVAVSRDPRALRAAAIVVGGARPGRRRRRRRSRLGPVLELGHRVPEPAADSTSAIFPAPDATTSTASRSTPSAKSPSPATVPGPTSSPGSSCARSRRRSTTRTPSTWRRSPSWG